MHVVQSPGAPPRPTRRSRRAALVLLVAVVLGSAACGMAGPSSTAGSTAAGPATPSFSPDAGAASTSVAEGTAAPAPTPTQAPVMPAALAAGFRVHAYPIVDLAIADRAYAETGDAPLEVDYPADENGVPSTPAMAGHTCTR